MDDYQSALKTYAEIVDEQFRKRFKRVYQGGHHDVWCNSRTHVTLSGGMFGKSPIDKECILAEISLSSCDCSKYKDKSNED